MEKKNKKKTTTQKCELLSSWIRNRKSLPWNRTRSKEQQVAKNAMTYWKVQL